MIPTYLTASSVLPLVLWYRNGEPEFAPWMDFHFVILHLRIWEFERWEMYLFLPDSSPGGYLGSLNYVEALRPPPHSWNPPVIKNIRWIWHNHSSPFVYIVEKICQTNPNKCNLNKSFSPCLGPCCSQADECWIDPANKNCISCTYFIWYFKRHPVSFQRTGCPCFQKNTRIFAHTGCLFTGSKCTHCHRMNSN